MKLIVLILACLIACVVSYPTQLKYAVNQEFVYSVNGYLDARGDLVTSRTSGSFSTMNGTLVTQCIQVDSNYYMFVMNMFDVTVGVGQGPASSNGAISEIQTLVPEGAGDTPLGYDVYYKQFFNGSIPEVWINGQDSPYYVNVKLGAINAFQTKIVPPQQKALVLETAPVGVYKANIAGTSSSESLVLTKTFNQKDMQQFSDNNVKSNMVDLAATATTTVHSSGYIAASNVNQLVNMVNMGGAGSERKERRASVNGASTTGFDMTLSSKGVLGINMLSSSTVSETERLLDRHFSSLAELQADIDYVPSNLMEASRTATQKQLKLAANIEIDSLVPTAFDAKTTEEQAVPVMNKIAKHLRNYPKQLNKLYPYFRQIAAQSHLANRLFYTLALAGNKEAQELIVKKGIRSAKETIKIQALLAVSHIKKPEQFLVKHVQFVATESSDENIAGVALVSYSNIIRDASEKVRQVAKKILLKRLYLSIESRNTQSIVASLLLIHNAELSVSEEEIVVSALADFKNKHINLALAQLLPQSETVSRIAQFQAVNQAINFPFNKSIDEHAKLGGSEVSANFNAELFAGTNFDCNEPTFNYEALAEATATLDMMGFSGEAFDAKAIYGKANGAVVGDSITLHVFGKLIYDKPLPVLDCSLHTYPLAHTAPGFDVSYTVWVSIIPITFSADASLVLDLKWGWEVCDSPLLAEVELIPSGSFVISGNAVIDLLLLKAGLQLSGSINSQLIPQGKIIGNECSIDFDVDWVTTPMSANFNAYYEWKSCKFLIFDCHWGEHHVDTLWNWSEAPHNDVLFDKTFKIIH